jgi:hypothetical protein
MKKKAVLAGILGLALVCGLLLTGCKGTIDGDIVGKWGVGSSVLYEFKANGELVLLEGALNNSFAKSGVNFTYTTKGNQVTMKYGVLGIFKIKATASATWKVEGNVLTLEGEETSGFATGTYNKIN